MKNAKKQTYRGTVLYRITAALLPVFALLASTAFVLFCAARVKVRPTVTIELGTESPAAAAFARNGADVAYRTAPQTRYRSAGSYRLWVNAGVLPVPVSLRVVDTVAPTADGTETTVSAKQAPTPDKLIKNLRDESVVKVTFETAPDYGTVGDYDSVVLLEDASGNQSRVPVKVHVRIAADKVVAEAGGAAPKAEDFLIDTYGDVRMDPISDAMLREPGEYPIRITADGMETESLLIVTDTVPPAGRGITCVVAPNAPIRAEDFVADIRDETEVAVSLATQPDLDCLTPQTVGVILRDRGGNETTVYGTLLISSVAPQRIEAHSGPLSVSELKIEGEYAEAKMSEAFTPNVPGVYTVGVLIDGQENYALIEVMDTIPPKIEVHRTDAYLSHPLPADVFAEASDATGAALAYRTEPDWTKERQDVTLIATDAVGNQSERTFALSLLPDTEPPVLYGVIDRIAYVGEPIAYLSEVTAEDDADGSTPVTVESEVIPDREGKYRVVYTAEDTAGNRTSETCMFTLVSAAVSEETVRTLAQGVLKEIITDGMVTAEKLKAVYDYVQKHLRYVGNSDKSDWRKEAVRGFRTGRGDCFTFYSVTRALLNELGVDYMSVTRLGGATQHFWTIVNVGTGWYHFDAINFFPWNRCFMWTNGQCQIKPYFWKYDHAKYPEIAIEPFDYDAVVQMEREGLLP